MNLNVSAAPHIRSKDSTSKIMLDVLIALVPALIAAVIIFGFRALVLTAISAAACVVFEALMCLAMRRKMTVGDLSAVVTGVLLAFSLPVSCPYWVVIVGDAFAIIVVKQLYGGLGQNFMNPALAARCFLLISFAGKMTNFSYSGFDGVSGATPLAVLKSGGTVDVPAMFMGNIPGTIGEVSVIALLIGAAYLLAKKVISIRIPGTYILTVVVFAILFGGHGFDLNYIAAHLCGGGLIFGAFFMATDYVTSPITPKGQIVFGILLGVLTGLFRIFGGSAEGVSYAIIISNILVPLIEKVTLPKAFGKEGK